MKARYNPMTKKERETAKEFILNQVNELFELKGNLITIRVISSCCISLNESLGLGKERLSKFIYQLGNHSEEQIEWVKDDVGDYILGKKLRRIGMDALADALNEERKRVEAFLAEKVEEEEKRSSC